MIVFIRKPRKFVKIIQIIYKTYITISRKKFMYTINFLTKLHSRSHLFLFFSLVVIMLKKNQK